MAIRASGSTPSTVQARRAELPGHYACAAADVEDVTPGAGGDDRLHQGVLPRDGPGALTTRAVTAEAGCAKGVLHRHFADFDAFLAELVHDRIAWLDTWAAELRGRAGTGTVTDNLTAALT